MRGEDCFRYSNEFEIISRLPASGEGGTFSYTSSIGGKTYNVTLSMSGGSLLLTIKDTTTTHTSVFTPAGYDWFMCPGV